MNTNSAYRPPSAQVTAAQRYSFMAKAANSPNHTRLVDESSRTVSVRQANSRYQRHLRSIIAYSADSAKSDSWQIM